ncbi:MAG: histidinol-phosphate transaminase, partial [Thermodesulfobacteriota bacterium]
MVKAIKVKISHPFKIRIPEYILSISPYVPGKPIEEVEREYGISGAAKLASNENPLGPSPKAIRALMKALPDLNRYPDGSGKRLIQKLAETLKVKEGNIVLGNGSDEIIGMLTRGLLAPGDEAIMPKPSFLMYDIMVRSVGAHGIEVPLKGFETDLDQMAARINSKTRMIFLNNPHNPAGSLISRNAFNRFLNQVPDDLVIVVDEAYIEFVRDPRCFSGFDYLKSGKPVVALRTFSKAYGLAGLRIGYGVMDERLAEVLNRIRQPFNANSLAQAAATAALDDHAFLKKSRSLVHREIDFLYNALKSLGVGFIPTQANYILMDVGQCADDLFIRLLKEGVIVRSMSSYGYPQSIRVSIGLHAQNVKFVNALKKSLKLKSDRLPVEKAGNCRISNTGRKHRGPLLITVDGPAGAGKSTTCRALAEHLGYRYVDTGALYRSVAYEAMRAGIATDDDTGLSGLCDSLDIHLAPGASGFRLISQGKEITDRIRTPEIAMAASAASARKPVRDYLLRLQRALGERKGAVFEGRDMGTVVFPDADVKFFLDASSRVRARRRYDERKHHSTQSLKEVEADL